MMEKRVRFRLETNMDDVKSETVDIEEIAKNVPGVTSYTEDYTTKELVEKLKEDYLSEVKEFKRGYIPEQTLPQESFITSHEFVNDKTSVLEVHFHGEEEKVNEGIEELKNKLNQFNYKDTDFGIKNVEVERHFVGMVEPYLEESDIILSTTKSIPGQEIEEIIDVVSGNIVVPDTTEADIELKQNDDVFKNPNMMKDVRKQAMNRMTRTAEKIDADAIINVDFKSSRLPGSKAGGETERVEMEILTLGTAVKLK